MRKHYWHRVLWAAFLAGSGLQVAVLLTVYEKGGGTTGAEPFMIAVPFVFSFILGLYARVRKRDTTTRILSSVVIVVSLFGCLLPYWLERTGSLVQYDRWLLNNQSPNTESPGLHLILFGGALLLAMLITVLLESKVIGSRDEI